MSLCFLQSYVGRKQAGKLKLSPISRRKFYTVIFWILNLNTILFWIPEKNSLCPQQQPTFSFKPNGTHKPNVCTEFCCFFLKCVKLTCKYTDVWGWLYTAQKQKRTQHKSTSVQIIKKKLNVNVDHENKWKVCVMIQSFLWHWVYAPFSFNLCSVSSPISMVCCQNFSQFHFGPSLSMQFCVSCLIFALESSKRPLTLMLFYPFRFPLAAASDFLRALTPLCPFRISLEDSL